MPLSSSNGHFKVGFCRSVEVHDCASVLQLQNQGMSVRSQFGRNVHRRNVATNGIYALFLNFAIHKMPHQSWKPDNLVHAKGFPEGPIECDVSRGDCRVWEPKH